MGSVVLRLDTLQLTYTRARKALKDYRTPNRIKITLPRWCPMTLTWPSILERMLTTPVAQTVRKNNKIMLTSLASVAWHIMHFVHLRWPSPFNGAVRVKVEAVRRGDTIAIFVEIINQRLTPRRADLKPRGAQRYALNTSLEHNQQKMKTSCTRGTCPRT